MAGGVRTNLAHFYVPAYYPDKDTPPVLCIDPVRRAEWLNAVYLFFVKIVIAGFHSYAGI